MHAGENTFETLNLWGNVMWLLGSPEEGYVSAVAGLDLGELLTQCVGESSICI